MPFTTRRSFLQQGAFATALGTMPKWMFAGVDRLPETDDQNHVPLETAAIRKLAAGLNGRIITPEAGEYDTARLGFNRAFDRHPALIVCCASGTDVVRALEFAQVHRLPLAVRSGGHSRAGLNSCDGGVVIDLAAMKQIQVDAEKRTAHMEAGCLVSDLDDATQRFNLATTGGGCPNVGMAGFTLGGGEGLLMSMLGAGCDNLLSARVVLADGKEVTASHESNPDLFWAIRGGGGNFGVATSFEYRLHPVGNVLKGALTYPSGRIPELLQGFDKFTRAAPDEMAPLGELLPSEQGPRFINHLCYFGDARIGDKLLAPLRTAIPPDSDDMKAMSYRQAQAEGFRPKPFAHFETNVIVPNLNAPVADLIDTAIRNAPPQFRVLIVPFFGAITRVNANEMAFALRQAGFELDILCGWVNPADRERATKWVRALGDSLRPFSRGSYVNQLGETSEELVRAGYGPNYARLAQLKKKYDPNNVLRVNQNIVPA